MQKAIVGLLAIALVLSMTVPALAQETTVKGNLGGLAVDSTGAVVPGANVTITGAIGSKTDKTDEAGNFMFNLLTPGFYAVKVEKQGFKTATIKAVEVTVGKISAIRVTLEPGAVSEVVEVTAQAAVIDTTSTAVGANLPDTFYQSVPVQRNVAGLFYITPGAVSGGGTGVANPSISGASGLENMYVADGVNITDRAFGGLGVFSRRYGSVGSGINLSFIKEVDVKSGGFEPQYGQATGGIVQMVTKSGSSSFHGEIGGYFAPRDFEATRNQTDLVRVNKNGFDLNQGAYDVDGEIGGYVPGFKNHLFFFASVDPTFNQHFVAPGATSGLALSHPGEYKLQTDVYNYAGKLTFKINDNHTVESSLFGDPSRTTTGPNATTAVLNANNNLAFDRWNYGTRNWVVRYNGTLSPSWLANFSFTWNNTKFTDTPLANVPQVTDRTLSSNVHLVQGFGFLEDSFANTYALNFDTQKVGHWLGQHTLSIGYRYERDNYNDFKVASGGRFDTPTTNMLGGAIFSCAAGDPSCPAGQTSYMWAGSLRDASTLATPCDLCPLYPQGGIAGNPLIPVYVNFGRGEFDPSTVPTTGRYHAAYVNDSWEISKHINISAGLRWETWRMDGTGAGYIFTDNWSPRIGIAIDPWGDHKTKIYANFGRYQYQTPLDAAVRSLSGEKDVIGMAFAPGNTGGVVDTNPDGSLNMILDSAHVLNLAGYSGNPSTCGAPPCGVPNGISVGASPFGTAFAPNTKMMYQNEWVVGAEHQFHNGVVVTARFLYRNLPRTLDDVSGVSPEGYAFANGVGGVPSTFMYQNYFIANPNPHLDLFPNPTETLTSAAGCGAIPGAFYENPVLDVNLGANNPATGAPWAAQGICYAPNAAGFYGGEISPVDGSPIPDGIGDGFPLPIHNYKAVEVEVNKAFANNWMLRANWRIASLTGNYEGAFRNDNGQTDPNISSLFDFTNGIIGMLGDQYAIGPLNTDRRHVINVYTSYVFSSTFLKNLELGAGLNIQSGTPISELANHPAYGNAGEVPLGGRGKLGRVPVNSTINLHLDRPFKVTEKSQLHLTADLFNLTNNKQVTLFDQTSQIGFSSDANPDFLNPSIWQYQRPFYARFSFRWVF